MGLHAAAPRAAAPGLGRIPAETSEMARVSGKRGPGRRQPCLLLVCALCLVSFAGGARAAIDFIGATTADSGNATVDSVSIAPPAGTPAGALLVAQIALRGNPPPAFTVVPPGWTEIPGSGLTVGTGANGLRSTLFYKFYDPTDPPGYLFQWASAARYAAGLLAYSGVHPVDPVDAAAAQGVNSSVTLTAPALMSSFDGTREIWFWSYARGNQTGVIGDQSPDADAATRYQAFTSGSQGRGNQGVQIRANDRPQGWARLLPWQTAQFTTTNARANIGQTLVLRAAGPRLQLNMDEPAWTGAAGEVADASGSGFHGTAEGGATTSDALPVIPGSPGSCGYGVFDGVDDGVLIGPVDLGLQNAMTVMAWVRWGIPPGSGAPWANLVTSNQRSGNGDIGQFWLQHSSNNGRYEFAVQTNAGRRFVQSAAAPQQGLWQHVAGVYDGTSIRIYVNGALSGQVAHSGVILPQFGAFDLTVGRWANPGNQFRRFTGDLDELRVYGGALSPAEIQAAAQATRPCPGAELLAEYRMDEPVWAGAGSVLDASGNDRHASPVGGVSTADADPAIPGNPGTCGYGLFPRNTSLAAIDAVDTGLKVDADIGARGSVTFWYQYNRRWRAGSGPAPENNMLLDASNNLGNNAADRKFFLAKRSNGRLRFHVEDNAKNRIQANTGVFNFPAGTWVHIGVSWDLPAKRLEIYVNGAPAASAGLPASTGLPGNWNTLYIGDNRSTGLGQDGYPNRSADGQIDQVRIYGSVIDQATVQADMAAVHPCLIQTLSHFRIDVGAGVASTCVPRAVTISARDASDNVLGSYAGTVQITTSSGHGNWSRVSAAGALVPEPHGADDGAVQYSFDSADGGVAVLALSNVRAEDLSVSVADPGIPVTSVSPPLAFRDNAFVVTVDSAEQVAGRPANLGLALWTREPEGGLCAVAAEYDGAKDLKAWYLADADHPPGAVPPALEAVPLGTGVPAVDNLTGVVFSAGQANLTLSTADVGKFALALRDDSRSFAGAVDVDGGSGTLTVRPFGLGFTDINAAGNPNPGADSPVGTVFARAGEAFAATVGAYLWNAAQDDGSGRPLAGADITGNGLTPSFAWPVTLEAVLDQPAGGVLGGFGGGSLGAAAFSGGQAEASGLSYLEAGSIRLRAEAVGFLNSPVSVSGSSAVVGRFAAHHFEFDVDVVPELQAACGAFTYIDQPFDYGTAPVITARAMAQGGLSALHNYNDFGPGGNWWRLDLSPGAGGVDTLYAAPGAPPEVVLDSAASSYSPSSGSGTHGAVALGLAGPFMFDDRGSAPYGPVEPFDAALRLELTVTDQDGATGSLVVDPLNFPAPAQRWGRLVVDSAIGSELLPLVLPLRAEFFQSGAFVANPGDGCTAFSLASHIRLSNPETAGGAAQPGTATMTLGGGSTAVTSGDPALAAGLAGLGFSAPGAGNTGFVDVRVDLGAALTPWLAYDWDGDGEHDDDPLGRASFGLFPGQLPFIYIREPWD